MGWERRGSRKYYYRKRRVGKRVISTYVPEELSAVMDRLVQAERASRQTARETEQRERARIEVADGALDELESLTELLTAAALVAEGFHKHKRQWRRTRGKTKG